MKKLIHVVSHVLLAFLVVVLGLVVGILLGRLTPRVRSDAPATSAASFRSVRASDRAPARLLHARVGPEVRHRLVDEGVLAQPHVAAVAGVVRSAVPEPRA